VLACYSVSLESGDPKAKAKCLPVLDDYYECLHHKKEVRWRGWERGGDSAQDLC
jgi:NADH dehydrogenase (ubiquinone) Fe-S protein 5